MFDNMENLTLISSHSGVSKRYTKVLNRKTHVFLFRRTGTGKFVFVNQTLFSTPGNILFIPAGTSYEFYTASEEECTYSSIAFNADLNGTEPALFPLENFPDADYMINHFPNLWEIGNQSDRYKCISMFYNLIAYISNIEHQSYADRRKFDIIEPAVDYLKKHIFDKTLKTDTLHIQCGISDTYFRKIFVSRFGMTPQQYITAKRLSQAKSILDSASFDTISEISLSVGYKDPLYFSRIFKKKYGFPPSHTIY